MLIIQLDDISWHMVGVTVNVPFTNSTNLAGLCVANGFSLNNVSNATFANVSAVPAVTPPNITDSDIGSVPCRR